MPENNSARIRGIFARRARVSFAGPDWLKTSANAWNGSPGTLWVRVQIHGSSVDDAIKVRRFAVGKPQQRTEEVGAPVSFGQHPTDNFGRGNAFDGIRG